MVGGSQFSHVTVLPRVIRTVSGKKEYSRMAINACDTPNNGEVTGMVHSLAPGPGRGAVGGVRSEKQPEATASVAAVRATTAPICVGNEARIMAQRTTITPFMKGCGVQ